MKPFREDVEYRYYKTDDFMVMVWKAHPASRNQDFGKMVKILPDYLQAVIEVARFMFDQENVVLGDYTTIISLPHGFRLKIDFPFIKRKGEEKELILDKKRIVEVQLLPRVGYHGKSEDLPFAKVLDWNLGEFKCDDEW